MKKSLCLSLLLLSMSYALAGGVSTEKISNGGRILKQTLEQQKRDWENPELKRKEKEEIFRAIMKKNLSQIEQKINRINVNCRDKYGNTPLIKAVEIKHIKGIEYLLSIGADVFMQNNFGERAIDKLTKDIIRDLLYKFNFIGEKRNFTIDSFSEIDEAEAFAQYLNKLKLLLTNFKDEKIVLSDEQVRRVTEFFKNNTNRIVFSSQIKVVRQEYNDQKLDLQKEWSEQCGVEWPNSNVTTLHHIVPINSGGVNVWWNSIPMFIGDHKVLHSTPEEKACFSHKDFEKKCCRIFLNFIKNHYPENSKKIQDYRRNRLIDDPIPHVDLTIFEILQNNETLYLFKSFKEGNIQNIKKAINKNTAIKTYSGEYPLIAVISSQKFDSKTKCRIISLLLKNGADINYVDAGGLSVLDHAEKIRDPYLINYLIKKGAISGMLITSSSGSDDLRSFNSTDSDESSNLGKSIENDSYSKGNGFLRD